MSDEEQQEQPTTEEEPQLSASSAAPAEKPRQPVFNNEDDSGRNEAQIRMEEEKKKRFAKIEEEMKEYEEMRKEEREKLQAEIADLRAKREQRKQERAEEEKRLAEMRAVEEQKRRAEEEERQRRKREEEALRKEERERRKREAEERLKSESQRNFTISKKSGGEHETKAGIGGLDESKQGKSKEQLEAEKKATLEQRVQPLNIDGFSEQQLQEKAKELFKRIYGLEGDKYDLEQRFKTQNMEIVELSERARQMQKGGQKGSSSKVQTAPDPLAEKLSGIPPKIIMYSQYERVKDHRGFGERQELYKGPQYGVEYQRIMPTNKVVITDQGPRVVGSNEDGNHDGGPAAEAEAGAE